MEKARAIYAAILCITAIFVACENPVTIERESDVISSVQNNENMKSLSFESTEIDTALYLQQLNEIIEAEKPGLEVYSMLTLEANNTELDLSKGAVKESQILSSSYPVEYVDFGPYGGNGGTSFSAELYTSPSEQWRRLHQLQIRAGNRIDAIRPIWRNNHNQIFSSPWHGGTGGSIYYLNLASNEYITAVYIRHGNEVDNLTFVTNFKIFSTGYGTGGTLTVVNFGNAGLQNHGFFGRSGNRVDKLGFYGYTHDKF